MTITARQKSILTHAQEVRTGWAKVDKDCRHQQGFCDPWLAAEEERNRTDWLALQETIDSGTIPPFPPCPHDLQALCLLAHISDGGTRLECSLQPASCGFALAIEPLPQVNH